jgi:signal transduction histidine kinase
MLHLKIGLPGLLLFILCLSVKGIPIDDKSSERPILASEKKVVERLIARATYLQLMKNDSCLVLASEAMHIARAYNSTLYEAQAVQVMADYYFDKERYKDALERFKELIMLYTHTGDSLNKANCHNQMGLAYFNLAIYDNAIQSYHDAMRLAIYQNDTLLIAKCNQNIGVLYAELKRPAEAMNYYQKALDLHRILKNREDEAGVLQNIGIICEDEKKYKEALGYYLSALKIFESFHDSVSIATMYLNLGSLYEDQADYVKCLSYYNRSIALFKSENYKFGLAYSYFSLGSVYNKTGEYEKAIGYLQSSLEYSKMISLVENEADCHRLLAAVYASLGDYANAFGELKDYDSLHDSMYNENVEKQIAENELRYRTRLKDSEIEHLKNEREKAVKDMIRRTITLTSIVTLTIIVIAVSVYYSKNLKKANESLVREIDERTRAEKELLNIKESLEEHVIERTRELEKAKIKAEESDKLKSAFIANMSHEIRTPLNAITGFSGLLLRNDISPEKKAEYNDQIIKNNRILVNMIEDLIDTSKIESGSLQLHPSHINPGHILSQLKEPIFENMAKKNKPFIEIIQEKADIKTSAFVADPMRLQQVLWHLLDNAVKFTVQGSIRYGCFENHQNIIFYVNDTGIGIPQDAGEIIFEKFRQLDETTRRKYGGTGLGLYYAQKIAEVMQGRIWFESKAEGGSIFYFSLPISPTLQTN